MSLHAMTSLHRVAALLLAVRAPAALPSTAPSAADAAHADSLPRAATAAAAAPTAELREAVARLAGGAPEARHVVVSLRDRRLWVMEGDSVRFTAPVAVGRATPRMLANPGAPRPFAATPAGRFVVERRDSMPQWVPPDWYYAEQAQKLGRPLRHLARGEALTTRDGATIRVDGEHVVAVNAAGVATRLSAARGPEIVVDGAILVPPLGTAARRYAGVLGPRRLALGGELGIHGTNDPSSIGKAATHGCIRLTNDAITELYTLVPLGTPVYIV
jgi:lipoprotein-anchoring transpeptidase ErfK/SrfK